MPVIHVVGLGPGGMDALPVATHRLLTSGLPVVLRTAVHPVVAELRRDGVRFDSFDELYERGERFEEIYRDMAERLLTRARRDGDLVYAVPGHPLMAEQSVQMLRSLADGTEVEVRIGPGHSFLDAVCAAVGLDPIDGLLLLDGTSLRPEQLQPGVHLVIAQVFQRHVASDVKLTLMEVYPDDHRVTVVRAAGVPGEQRVIEVPLYELDRLDVIDHLTTVVVPALPNDLTRRRDPWFVADLVRRLRGPDGCPWDRKQTHQSLRRYVIEEAYEVADAIDAGDPDALADELGDLYLQILLHAQIASESGDFDLRDVYAALAEKLIRRHPHVFGQAAAQTASDAQARWEDIKRAERAKRAAETGRDAPESILEEVRRGRPAWMVAKALQKKAAEVGFDWDRATEVADKVREEAAELAAEIERAGGSDERVAEELGDVLFAIVNLARWLDLDVEEALAKANRKFEQRFRHVERRVRESGRPWSDFSLAELDEYWNEAKIQADSLEQQEFAGKERIT